MLIKLKQQYWPYDTESQKRWLLDNINHDDYHVMLTDGVVLFAYLNMVNVEVTVDNQQYKMLGVGNVCVDGSQTNNGLGGVLMAYINAFIKKTQLCGVLLCKEEVIDFYRKSNWKVMTANKVVVQGCPFDHYVMMYDPMKVITSRPSSLVSFSRNF